MSEAKDSRPVCTGFWKNGEKCNYPQKYGDHCGHHKLEGVEKVKRNICMGFEDDGTACADVRTNGKHCDRHEEKEIQIQRKKDKLIKIQNKIIVFFLEIGKTFKLSIELTNDDFISERISEDEYSSDQLEKEFQGRTVLQVENFIITETPLLLKIKPENSSSFKFRYFIGVKFNKIPIIISPIFIRKDIINQFCCVLYQDFDIIKTVRLSYGDRIYPCSSEHIKLHEIIHGKKGEDQGWYLVNKNDPDNSTEAIWITMLSGRSVNQYDPNPDDLNFYYYHNEENGFNIKVPEPKKFINFTQFPSINEGKQGDFYKSIDGNIYFKVDEHVLDHSGNNPLDARKHKIREIFYIANIVHADKKQKNKFRGVCPVKKKAKNKNIKGYQACVGNGMIKYRRTFSTELAAAKFYDYHVLAVYGVHVLNNNTLTKQEEEEVLLHGLEKIPEEYRYIPRFDQYPKGITYLKNVERYQLSRESKKFGIKLFHNRYKTYEEVYTAWQAYEKRLEDLKDEKRDQTLKDNSHNIEGKYGYLEIVHKGKIYKVKLNLATYLEFVHCKWTINEKGYPTGIYKKKLKNLHLHVFKFYNVKYNKKLDGSIDHSKQDKLNATIEFLRPASAAQQGQNRTLRGPVGYSGINVTASSFVCCYAAISTTTHEHLQDALEKYNSLVREHLKDQNGNTAEGNLHIIPEGKTTVADLFGDLNKFDENYINKSSIALTQAFVNSNPRLMNALEISNTTMICNNNEKFFKREIINYKLGLPVASVKKIYDPKTITLETLQKAKLSEIKYIRSINTKFGLRVCQFEIYIKASTCEVIRQKMISLLFGDNKN